MKYCKISYQRIFDTKEEVLGHANGEFVSVGCGYFDRIGKGEIIDDAPLFDYFHLQSYGEKKDWEWRLQDVHGGIGDYPGNGNWYISDDFKRLLENFSIAPQYHFYETRLLYKGEKLKYWIFQFIAAYRKLNKMQCVDFSKSVFKLDKTLLCYDSYEDYSNKTNDIYSKLKIEKITLISAYDFMPLNPISSDIIVSEKLKETIEDMHLKGFLFSELDYKVVVEKKP
jgi:hypothetical protein